MKTLQKVCIVCPAGCHLEITEADNGTVTVTGNNCPRGRQYAQNELHDPRRTVTGVVAVAGSEPGFLPVKSSAPVPVRLIPGLLAQLRRTSAQAPVKIGDCLLANIENTGIDVIFTRDSTPIQ